MTKSMGSGLRGAIVPHSSPLVEPHIYLVSSIGLSPVLPNTGQTSINWSKPSDGWPRWSWCGAFAFWRQAEGIVLVQSREEVASGDLQQPSQCFKGHRQEDGTRLFAVLCSGSVTENGHKLKQWRFRLVRREKKNSPWRWSRSLVRLQAPSLESFKIWLLRNNIKRQNKLQMK